MDEIRNTDGAARYVGLGRSTLEKMRCTGDGPKFIRLGPRRVGYRQRDLDEWLDSRPQCTSTSEVETTPGPGRPRKRATASSAPEMV
jgi:predicted DNA-binding transcriptional regulator AlpA